MGFTLQIYQWLNKWSSHHLTTSVMIGSRVSGIHINLPMWLGHDTRSLGMYQKDVYMYHICIWYMLYHISMCILFIMCICIYIYIFYIYILHMIEINMNSASLHIFFTRFSNSFSHFKCTSRRGAASTSGGETNPEAWPMAHLPWGLGKVWRLKMGGDLYGCFFPFGLGMCLPLFLFGCCSRSSSSSSSSSSSNVDS